MREVSDDIARISQANEQDVSRDVDLSGTFDLATLIDCALVVDHGIRAKIYRARAQLHAARAASQLPSAEAELQIWNVPLERPYALGEAEMVMVELRQRFPPAGSRDAEASVMLAEAEEVLAEIREDEVAIALRVSLAYVDYAQAYELSNLVAERQASLARDLRLAELRQTTQTGSLADIARLQVERAGLQQSAIRAASNIERAKVTLNRLLTRASDAPLGEPSFLVAPDLPLLEEEYETGQEQMAEARVRASEARTRFAEAEAGRPEVMFGVGYWQVPSMRPGFGLSLGMTLPWLWGPGRERVEAAHAAELAEREEREATEWNVRLQIAEGYQELVTKHREWRFVRDETLPATLALGDATQIGYSSGSIDLQEWLDSNRMTFEAKMEELLLRGEVVRAHMSLQRATGNRRSAQ